MGWQKGRPRKPAALEGTAEPTQESTSQKSFSKGSRWTMKAGANWATATDDADHIDKLHIPKDFIPEGMDMQWVTDTVLGQGMPQHRATFERKGWTPVHPEDFDGRFDGMFTSKGSQEEINYNGLVLMARPMELTLKARARDKAAAREQITIKEQALTGGHLDGVTGADHSSARQFNHIRRSVERVEVPKE